MSEATCSIVGCSNPVHARGMCSKHYQRDYAARPKPSRPTKCRQCGIPINQVKRPGRYATFCSRKCQDACLLAERRALHQERLTERSCDYCRRVFRPAYKVSQRFCSKACSNGAGIKRRVESGDVCSEDDCSRVRYSKELCKYHFVKAKRDAERAAAGPLVIECEHCGHRFEAETRGKRFCSVRCRKRARYLREKANPSRVCSVEYCGRPHWARGLCLVHYRREFFPDSERSDWLSQKRRLAIYERDQYFCYICGVKTNPKGDSSKDLDAPTLDHVVPRSKGGSDEDDNLRTCCRLCNSQKTFLDYSARQLPLIA